MILAAAIGVAVCISAIAWRIGDRDSILQGALFLVAILACVGGYFAYRSRLVAGDSDVQKQLTDLKGRLSKVENTLETLLRLVKLAPNPENKKEDAKNG